MNNEQGLPVRRDQDPALCVRCTGFFDIWFFMHVIFVQCFVIVATVD